MKQRKRLGHFWTLRKLLLLACFSVFARSGDCEDRRMSETAFCGDGKE